MSKVKHTGKTLNKTKLATKTRKRTSNNRQSDSSGLSDSSESEAESESSGDDDSNSQSDGAKSDELQDEVRFVLLLGGFSYCHVHCSAQFYEEIPSLVSETPLVPTKPFQELGHQSLMTRRRLVIRKARIPSQRHMP